MQKKMPYGGRPKTDFSDGTYSDMKDNDPRVQQAFQAMFLTPGMGLGTKTWDPTTGITREQQRKEARGMSAQERMKVLMEAGVTDREGMTQVFRRAYASPERAFMLGRGR
jgi:hypothetical protein